MTFRRFRLPLLAAVGASFGASSSACSSFQVPPYVCSRRSPCSHGRTFISSSSSSCGYPSSLVCQVNGHYQRHQQRQWPPLIGSSSPSSAQFANNIDDEARSSDEEEQKRPLQQFESILDSMSLNPNIRSTIPALLLSAGFETSAELILFASDFVDCTASSSPQVLSKVLQDDFGFNPYQSHLCRAALFELVRKEKGGEEIEKSSSSDSDIAKDATDAAKLDEIGEGDAINMSDRLNTYDTGTASVEYSSSSDPSNGVSTTNTSQQMQQDGDAPSKAGKRPPFKSVVVNKKAKKRGQTAGHQYGLPSNYDVLYPTVGKEMKEFMTYMTRPSASSQEAPIREATAKVYLRHATLFLGWYLREGEGTDLLDMETIRSAMEEDRCDYDKISDCCKRYSLHTIIPTKEAASAQPIVDFILWLRQTRDISHSYEANILRGLTKLLKYRFASESTADPTYGEKSFHDIPAVRELRKLHRDAEKKRAKSPRSSDEEAKWLSWSEYLGVVDALKREVVDELNSLDEMQDMPEKVGRRIATKYQRYLVLAFFSCVPDRQRTVRELELDRTFVRNDQENTWAVKHSPDDYKTGGTYGDRPPLGLSPELTQSIDDFLERWRPYLNPVGQHVFTQPRTGKPLTQDSVYAIVARSCYEHTGKKTNPHLLRDMIVTHVRDSSGATERDLEALALFMGHSVSMQRTSYDRRTIEQKVKPAVELLKSVNEGKDMNNN